MRHFIRIFRSSHFMLTLAATVAAAPVQTLAQSYPTKPIKLVVAFPVGTPTDIIGRAAAEQLAAALGQPVVVDNRPGVGGTLGTALVAGAPADGYTLLLASTGAIAVGPALFARVDFDPIKAFAPICLIGTAPMFLTVAASVPVTTVQEFIDFARKRPGQLYYASGGTGSVPHIMMEMFRSTIAKQGRPIELAHVPFKTSVDAHLAMINGTVHAMVDQVATLAPNLKSGKIRPLAVFSNGRVAQLPNVPSLTESGVPDLNVRPWFGLVAPRGTPENIVARLNSVTRQAVQSSELRDRLVRFGFDPAESTPEQFGALIATDVEKWGQAVKASGARID